MIQRRGAGSCVPTRTAPGLPFLVAGLLNSLSIVLVLVFFTQIGRGRGSQVATV